MNFRIFITAFAIAFALIGCGGARKPVYMLGSPGVQCEANQHRKVYCNDSLSEADCSALKEAVDYVNSVTKDSFFIYKGRTPNTAHENAGYDNLYVSYVKRPDTYHPGVAQVFMSTEAYTNVTTGCMQLVAIQVFVQTRFFSRGTLVSLFRHELGHVIGLPHEAEFFAGLMGHGIAIDEEAPVDFSSIEIAYLKALYPWI